MGERLSPKADTGFPPRGRLVIKYPSNPDDDSLTPGDILDEESLTPATLELINRLTGPLDRFIASLLGDDWR